ncbi:hypothetical protein JCM8547_008678, partial [Rhodosporidiobolus lusitaniae]
RMGGAAGVMRLLVSPMPPPPPPAGGGGGGPPPATVEKERVGDFRFELEDAHERARKAERALKETEKEWKAERRIAQLKAKKEVAEVEEKWRRVRDEENGQLGRTIASLREEVKRKEEELRKVEEEAEERSVERVKGLKDEKEGLEKRVVDLGRKWEGAETSALRAVEEVRRHREEKFEEERKALEEKLEAAKNDVAERTIAFEKRLRKAADNVEHLRQRNSENREAREKAEREREEKERQIEKVQKELDTVTTRHREALGDIASLEDRLAATSSSLSSHQADLAALSSDLSDILSSASEYRTSYDSLAVSASSAASIAQSERDKLVTLVSGRIESDKARIQKLSEAVRALPTLGGMVRKLEEAVKEEKQGREKEKGDTREVKRQLEDSAKKLAESEKERHGLKGLLRMKAEQVESIKKGAEAEIVKVRMQLFLSLSLLHSRTTYHYAVPIQFDARNADYAKLEKEASHHLDEMLDAQEVPQREKKSLETRVIELEKQIEEAKTRRATSRFISSAASKGSSSSPQASIAGSAYEGGGGYKVSA